MEKRQEKRLRRILRINLALEGKKVFGSLMDVSVGGMRIRALTRKHFLFNQNLFVQILNKKKVYDMPCRVRWQKEDLIDHSHILGLQFSKINPTFCEEVLQVTLGSKSAPYKYAFQSQDAFVNEFRNNILHGGLKLVWDGELPPLYKNLYVEILVPNTAQTCTMLGEVVAHVPGGVGLFIKNHDQVLKALKEWAP